MSENHVTDPNAPRHWRHLDRHRIGAVWQGRSGVEVAAKAAISPDVKAVLRQKVCYKLVLRRRQIVSYDFTDTCRRQLFQQRVQKGTLRLTPDDPARHQEGVQPGAPRRGQVE